MDFDPQTSIPKKWEKEIKGMAPDEMSERLSYHQTEMATKRTILADVRSHMANERTHLSYLRTSLSLMTFGISINRFSLYLKQKNVQHRVHFFLDETEFMGLGMVLAGFAILTWALHRYIKVTREIETNNYEIPMRSIKIITIIVLVFGSTGAIWLMFNRL